MEVTTLRTLLVTTYEAEGMLRYQFIARPFCSPRYSRSDDTRATLVISVQELHSTSANGMHSQHRVQYLRVFISLVTIGTIVRKH